MKAIEIKAREHFRNVKAEAFRPRFSPSFTASESDLVWVGNVPIPLEDYYKCLAAKDRTEARRLVRSSEHEGPAPMREESMAEKKDSQARTKGETR